MAQPTPPVADATKRSRGIDPEDPKWWRRFRRKAHAERQVRVELAIYAKDSRFLYAGAPYEFPPENVRAEGQTADADGVPSEMQKDDGEGPREGICAHKLSSSDAACELSSAPLPANPEQSTLQSPGPQAIEERQGPSPSQRLFSGSPEEHLPLMSIETYASPLGDSPCAHRDERASETVIKGAPGDERGPREGPEDDGLGGSNSGPTSPPKVDEVSVIDRVALMDDECYAVVQSNLNASMRALEPQKDGYRYKVMACAARMLSRPQLQYYSGTAGEALARPFDTQVGHYESGVRRTMTKKGGLPPDAKVVGVHDSIMADMAAQMLGHSAVQDD